MNINISICSMKQIIYTKNQIQTHLFFPWCQKCGEYPDHNVFLFLKLGIKRPYNYSTQNSILCTKSLGPSMHLLLAPAEGSFFSERKFQTKLLDLVSK